MKTKIRILFFFLFMLVSLTMQAQNTYYVNDNSTDGDIYCTAVGNDSNSGLSANLPKLTLGAAFTAAAAGDIIYVDKGTFTGSGNIMFTFNKAITIIGAGTGNTIFTSHTNNRFATIAANNVTIQNLQLYDFFLASGNGQALLVNANITGFKLTNVVMKKNFGSSTTGESIYLTSGSSSTFNGLYFSCSGYNGASGGAIKVNSCTLNVTNSAFSQSRDADGKGGAIEISGTTSVVNVSNTSFDGNSSRAGGAIAQNQGKLYVTNSCFNRNYIQGDSSSSTNGGGHYYAASTDANLIASFTNCKFQGAFFCATSNPTGYFCEASTNTSNDGAAISLRGTAGTFTFDTCLFDNSNMPALNFDNGLDFYVQATGAMLLTINNSKFANDLTNLSAAKARNIFISGTLNNTTQKVIVTNSGASATANRDGISGNNFSLSGTLTTGSNSAVATSDATASCGTTIAGCSITVNCLTESIPPVILKCVDNKTVACGTTLADYRSEVSAYDDCSFTVAQSPAAGSALSGTTTVTMTVTDQKGNFTTCTFTVTVNSSTWNGTEWSNGTPTAETAVTFTGNFSSTADLAACSVSVTNNAAVVINSGHNYTVQNAVTVDSGSTFTFNNNANLVQVNNVSNTGNIIMKRDTNPLKRLDYTIWSAPVAGQNLLAFSPSTLTNRFYTYNTATDVHSTVNPSTTSFATGLGYQIRVPNDHPISTPTIWTGTFTGVPNNGPYNVTISSAGNRYNMVGNPYPSTINLTTFSTVNSANFTGTIWFWRKENSIVTQGVWSTWNAGTFVLASDPGTSGLTITDNVARNGQGFLIKGNSGITTLSFTNAMRVTNTSNQFFRTEASDLNRIWLNLTSASGHFSQQAIRYSEGGTNELDRMDAENINNSDVLFTSLRSNVATETNKFTIQSRQYPFDVNDVVPLSVKVSTAGTYSIAIHQKDGLFQDGTQAIYLKDNLTNTETNINNGSYSFVSDAGVFDARFELKYVASALSNDQNNFDNNVVVYQQNEIIHINSNVEPIQNVKIFDIRGRLVHTADNINATSTNVKLNIEKQLLLMRITMSNGAVITRKILN